MMSSKSAHSFTYLITGAGGFLGKTLIHSLVNTGEFVVGVDRVELPAQDGVTFIQSDLKELDLLEPEISRHNEFVLIHLAWPMNRGNEYAPQAEAVHGFAHLLDWASTKKCRRVIAMGSADEYGTLGGELTESDLPGNHLSPYGWAKFSAGELLRAWSERTEIPYCWLRPFIIYGPGQQGDMLIPYALRMASERQNAKFSDGLQIRDFVHVQDIVRAIINASTIHDFVSGSYNLGSGEGTSLKEILLHIASYYKCEDLFQLGARSRRLDDPPIKVANVQKARSDLQWSPTISWKKGIDELCSST